MSSNHNFYKNFHGNNFTFQNNFVPRFSLPPPPLPPPYFMPTASLDQWKPKITDEEFVKSFEAKVSSTKPKSLKHTSISISQVREQLYDMVLIFNDLKKQGKTLENNISGFSEQEWSLNLKEIDLKKAKINELLANINDSHLDNLRRLVAKRAAKRLRLKRVRSERKRRKQEWIKESEERSRKIDENLQKIKDDIKKAKQEEEDKLQADIILKEVLRMKSDAKKCVVKLDALMKLRKARQNTARGRGEAVSESDAVAFNCYIEKLKALWTEKLATYEKEESEQRAKLKEDSEDQNSTSNKTEKEMSANLQKWREVMFGGAMPQVDFHRDIGRFVAVRSQWDQFLNSEGSALPIGWVPPAS